MARSIFSVALGLLLVTALVVVASGADDVAKLDPTNQVWFPRLPKYPKCKNALSGTNILSCLCARSKETLCAYHEKTNTCHKLKNGRQNDNEWKNLMNTSPDPETVFETCKGFFEDVKLPQINKKKLGQSLLDQAYAKVLDAELMCGEDKSDPARSTRWGPDTLHLASVIGDSNDVFEFIGKIVATAKYSVIVKTMRWEMDGSSHAHFKDGIMAAAARHSRGDKLRKFHIDVCYDEHRLQGDKNGGPPKEKKDVVGDEFAESRDVEVNMIRRTTAVMGTGHSKMVIIDHRYLIITSANFQDRGNQEMANLFTGSVVGGYMDKFDDDCRGGVDRAWRTVRMADLATREYVNEDLDTLVYDWHRSLPNGIGRPSGMRPQTMMVTTLMPVEENTLDPAAFMAKATLKTRTKGLVMHRAASEMPDRTFASNTQNTAFQSLMELSQKEIFVLTPNLNARPIVDALLAAARRGIKVTVVATYLFNDSRERMVGQGGANSDVLDYMYKQLEKTGNAKNFKGCWYQHRFKGGPTKSHVKLMIVDEEVVVMGSANMDSQSIFQSEEANLAVSNPQLAVSIKKMLKEVNLSDGVCYPAAKRPYDISLTDTIEPDRLPSISEMCSGEFPARIGFLPGSYSPVHMGHISLALAVANAVPLDCVYMVPAFDKSFEKGHVSQKYFPNRVKMLEDSVADYNNIRILKIPFITSDPMAAMKKDMPKVQWWFVVGDDIAGEYRAKFTRRKYVDNMLRHFHGMVISRRWYKMNDEDLTMDTRTSADNRDVSVITTTLEKKGKQIRFATEASLAFSSTNVREALQISEAETSKFLPIGANKYLFSPEGKVMKEMYLTPPPGSMSLFLANIAAQKAMRKKFSYSLSPAGTSSVNNPFKANRVGIIDVDITEQSMNYMYLRVAMARERVALDLVYVCPTTPGKAFSRAFDTLSYVIMDNEFCEAAQDHMHNPAGAGARFFYITDIPTINKAPNSFFTEDTSSSVSLVVFVDWAWWMKNENGVVSITGGAKPTIETMAGVEMSEIENTAKFAGYPEDGLVWVDRASPLPSDVAALPNQVCTEAKRHPLYRVKMPSDTGSDTRPWKRNPWDRDLKLNVEEDESIQTPNVEDSDEFSVWATMGSVADGESDDDGDNFDAVGSSSEPFSPLDDEEVDNPFDLR